MGAFSVTFSGRHLIFWEWLGIWVQLLIIDITQSYPESQSRRILIYLVVLEPHQSLLIRANRSYAVKSHSYTLKYAAEILQESISLSHSQLRMRYGNTCDLRIWRNCFTKSFESGQELKCVSGLSQTFNYYLFRDI